MLVSREVRMRHIRRTLTAYIHPAQVPTASKYHTHQPHILTTTTTTQCLHSLTIQKPSTEQVQMYYGSGTVDRIASGQRVLDRLYMCTQQMAALFWVK